MVLIDKFDDSIEGVDKVVIQALVAVMVLSLIASIALSELSINTRGIIRARVRRVKTAHTAIIYFLTAAVLGAVGQFLYKAGADRATGGWSSYVFNGRILLGVCCYAAVMVLFVAGFKQHGSPSVLYPLYASTFIWAALLDRVVYDKPILSMNVAGMILLVAGMFLMGLSPRAATTRSSATANEVNSGRIQASAMKELKTCIR